VIEGDAMGMDIDKLEAGPELDALVAARVMGLTVVRDPVSERGVSIGEAGPKGFDLKKYSTEIAAAWEVLEKLRCMLSKGKFGWVHVCAGPKNDGWEVQFVQAKFMEPGEIDFFLQAETAPLAICRAALKACISLQR